MEGTRNETRRARGRSSIQIENRIHVAASAERVLALAERVEDWPRILAHYRRVEVRAIRPEGRIVEMVALRAGVPVPVRWRTVQWLQAERPPYRVLYRHVGGVTRGMDVEWRIEPSAAGTDVTILHEFAPNWPWPGALFARYVVCGFFVHTIADRTLAGIKAAAESPGE